MVSSLDLLQVRSIVGQEAFGSLQRCELVNQVVTKGPGVFTLLQHLVLCDVARKPRVQLGNVPVLERGVCGGNDSERRFCITSAAGNTAPEHMSNTDRHVCISRQVLVFLN